MEWIYTIDYLVGKTNTFSLTNKLACFDLDDTLIKTKSGNKFPKNKYDWKFLYDSVPFKLFELINNGFSVIIITNQYGLNKNAKNSNNKKEEWISKINEIVNTLNNIPILVLCAIEKNIYRKPMTSLFELFILNPLLENNREIDRTVSFYCGDAAGRKKDHSNVDIKFAFNIELTYYVPESIFENKDTIMSIPKIDYIDFDNKDLHQIKDIPFEPKNKDLIIMVGFPACGKSSFAIFIHEKYGYVIINQDTLKTKLKCIKETEKYMTNGKSIIIDNTNPSKSIRLNYIQLAKKYNYNIRIVYVNCSKELAMHRNYYRLLQFGKYIPEMAYNIFINNFEHPNMDENINEIIIIKPNIVNDDKYYKYLY